MWVKGGSQCSSTPPGVELRILTAEDEPRPDPRDELIGLGPPP